MYMYALQKYSESDDIETISGDLSNMRYKGTVNDREWPCIMLAGNETLLLLCKVLLLRRSPLKMTLLVKWDLVSILLVLNGKFVAIQIN